MIVHLHKVTRWVCCVSTGFFFCFFKDGLIIIQMKMKCVSSRQIKCIFTSTLNHSFTGANSVWCHWSIWFMLLIFFSSYVICAECSSHCGGVLQGCGGARPGVHRNLQGPWEQRCHLQHAGGAQQQRHEWHRHPGRREWLTVRLHSTAHHFPDNIFELWLIRTARTALTWSCLDLLCRNGGTLTSSVVYWSPFSENFQNLCLQMVRLKS